MRLKLSQLTKKLKCYYRDQGKIYSYKEDFLLLTILSILLIQKANNR